MIEQPPNSSIRSALAEAIRREMNKELRPSEHFRASGIGSCVRKQVALRAGIAPTYPADDRTLVKMWIGTQFGKIIQAVLEADGFMATGWCEREVRYRSYVGHVDGRTRHITNGAIVELKSVDDDSITKYDSSPENFLWQGLLYCLATDVQKLLLYEIGRRQGISRERVYFITEEWKTKINQHITEVETSWELYQKTKELPPCIHHFVWENKSCPYREAKPHPPQEKLPDYNPFQSTKREQELARFLDKQTEDKGEIQD